MAARKMKKIFTVRGKNFYWGGSKFLYKGIWTWNGKRNVRIIALNNFKNWTGKYES
jgi:hypothetical protein